MDDEEMWDDDGPCVNVVLPPPQAAPPIFTSPRVSSSSDSFISSSYSPSKNKRKRPSENSYGYNTNKRFASTEFRDQSKPFRGKMTVCRTMNVETSKIGLIIGSRGSQIRELQDKSHTKIDIDKQTKEIRITGNESDVQYAEELISQLVQGGRNDSSTYENKRDQSMDRNSYNGGGEVSVDVPQNMVGRIIGKGGSNIRELEYNTGAKIKMDRDTNRVSISGNEEDVKKAKAAIDEIINNGADYRPSRETGSGFKSDNRDNDYSNSETVTMNVEQSLVGRVIGRGGATIKDIREKSGAKINIDKQTNEITITGDDYAVKTAQDEINRVIGVGGNNDFSSAPSKNYDDFGSGFGNNDYSNSNSKFSETVTMNVEQSKIGLVIGRGGATIRDITDKSGAKIDIDKQSNEVRITGDENAIKIAQDEINRVVGGGNNDFSSGHNKSFNDFGSDNKDFGGGFGDNDYSSSNTETVTMDVESSKIGRVIGRGGATIRDITEKSGAKIDIDKQSNEVRITGDENAIKIAQDEINRVIGGGNNDYSNAKSYNDFGSDNKDFGGGFGDNDYSSSNTETVTMDVDSSKIGRVIGRGGATIRDITEKSGAKIDIDKQSNEVRITGDENAIKIAQDEINRVIGGGNNDYSSAPSKSYNDFGSDNKDFGSGFGDNDYSSSNTETVTMDVDSSKIGRVIGRGGATIRDITEKSGAKIDIDKQSNEVRITGDENAIKIAQDEINRVVGGGGNNDYSSGPSKSFNDFGSDNRDFGSGFGSNDYSNSETVKINIDQSMIGRVIGRGGATIRDITEKSGAKIDIDKQTNEITITGDENAVKIAQDEINRVTGSFGGGYGGGSSNNANSKPPPVYDDYKEFPIFERRDRSTDRNGNNFKMNIEPSMIGSIIGRGGSKINELQEDSGARIKIDKSSNEITISGDNAAIEKAKMAIMNILDGNRPKSPVFREPAPRNDDDFELIDWEKINAECDKANAEKWAKCPRLVKNFYEESPEVANMSPEEVAQFREDNNNIVVDRTFKDENNPMLPIPNPVTKFEQCFAKYPDLMEQLQKQNFIKPSPIQSQAWPVLLKGEDLIGIAQTGTGKTLAFLLPAMIHTEYQETPRGERGGPNVLVLAPTRELAIQIEKEVQKYQFRGMKAACLYGGADRKVQIELMQNGVEIIICTPGRLNDLVSAGYIDITSITYLVLDEADRMLDMGFEPQIRKLLLDIRPDRQTVMTSATWPPGVRRLAQSYMKNPVQVYVGTLDLAACHSVTQIIEIIPEDEKTARIMEFAKNMAPDEKAIIFCGKKTRTDDLSSDFCLKGVRCQSLHGSRDQMDREQALADIKSGEVKILVATDVASRGLDIEDITHVVNFDFPRNIEEYVHRVGRTGRAGKTGISLSFFTREDWAYAAELIEILEEANQEVPEGLRDMAQRFAAKKERMAKEKAAFGGRGGGGRGGGRGHRDRW